MQQANWLDDANICVNACITNNISKTACFILHSVYMFNVRSLQQKQTRAKRIGVASH